MPKLTVRQTAQFKRDLKKARKQGKEMAAMDKAVSLLQNREPLPPKFKDHALTGDWKGYRECHVSPDWLLVYLVEDDVLVLTLTRTGSHAEIFGK
ncbi:type II toxin-antitoxin system YafQ family toxin [Synergistes jonesii]|uniref:type II toxin-antitoxin system YafQ family toxin n=1 Tax=Synergistes jonesii TaxID=2754 RepID=UPI003332885C